MEGSQDLNLTFGPDAFLLCFGIRKEGLVRVFATSFTTNFLNFFSFLLGKSP